MGARPGKICWTASPGQRKHAKRQVRRFRRRQEKKDPENAGTRLRHFTKGWAD